MSRTPNDMQESLFVAGLLKGLSKKDAAVQAGFAQSTATHSATRLYKRPSVQAALEAARKQVRDKAVYDVEACIAEINEAMIFARANKNSMALAKLIGLKADLMGLLVQKVDIRLTEKPDLRLAMAEARLRVVNPESRPAISAPALLPKPEPTIDIFGD